jgi:hypothetical protein
MIECPYCHGDSANGTHAARGCDDFMETQEVLQKQIDEYNDRLTIVDVKQKVWRTMNATEGSGFFVWDVMEVDAKDNPYAPYFDVCSDDTFIMPQCYHFFTKERAERFLNSNDYPAMIEVIVIRPELEKKNPAFFGPNAKMDWTKD